MPSPATKNRTLYSNLRRKLHLGFYRSVRQNRLEQAKVDAKECIGLIEEILKNMETPKKKKPQPKTAAVAPKVAVETPKKKKKFS